MSTETEIKPKMIVRVRDPSDFLADFARKIANRDAEVLWVGPTPQNMHAGKAEVRFLKRNGRGKEFTEIMSVRDLIPASVSVDQTGTWAS